MEDDYVARCEATYAKRLARVLRDMNVLTDEALLHLAYPGGDELDEAEGEIL